MSSNDSITGHVRDSETCAQACELCSREILAQMDNGWFTTNPRQVPPAPPSTPVAAAAAATAQTNLPPVPALSLTAGPSAPAQTPLRRTGRTRRPSTKAMESVERIEKTKRWSKKRKSPAARAKASGQRGEEARRQAGLVNRPVKRITLHLVRGPDGELKFNSSWLEQGRKWSQARMEALGLSQVDA